ncbi:BCCT family transporter [Paenactinomyces guangxiensis]|uniref:BCCT family transporter n=1 Tax=Paenactinomyces guangxiensis TaxID=1490290 RepID=A0A7W1WNM7_9BACL|nr:BCCT family transporter [Paenactinomyces guangxiensis]MBA4493140.1 BCCT family transporter [Paenactinomyces guangxiensis]MBH8590010.1 BCCT family transporter [Paenactinomyces guangxiensis]
MVFYISIAIILLFVIWGVAYPEVLASTANEAFNFTIEKFGWFYLIATLGFLIFSLYLAFSRYGKIRLGSNDDEPEYSNLSWFAMLFSAGMGIGLVFWGVAEPLSHYLTPPEGATGGTPRSAQLAMRYSFFHWGLHPWAIYTIISLALAYFKFRKGYKGLISWTFTPLLGDKVNGPIGKIIDILAIIATVFGVATSLGLGTLQINGGLNILTGTPNTIWVQLIIIAIVTVLYMISATTGLDKGIKILSNFNIILALALLLFVLFAGPTSFIFDTFTVTLGGYLQDLVEMSLRLTPFTQGDWVGSWTLFYWAWWIAWAPFVGTFIARVSKGRTIREFILGVLLIPSAFSFVWFSVFGGTALKFEIFDKFKLAAAAQEDVTSALFVTLNHLPLGLIIMGLATLLIITFFITSADSATFVLGMFSSNGDLNPSTRVKIIWGILQSAIAIVLLFSGGLQGLQKASIVAALPFAIIMVFMCFSLLKSLKTEIKEEQKKERERLKIIDLILSKKGQY